MLKKCFLCVFLLFSGILASDSEDLCVRPCECSKTVYPDSDFHVTYIDCSGANIENFPSTSTLRKDVGILNLSYNKIKKLVALDEYEVSNGNLKQLILSHNNIHYIDNFFFENLTNLRHLDLSYNNLQKIEGDDDVFTGLSKLTHLDLSFNALTTLPGELFRETTNLKHLNLSYNPLGEVLSDRNDALQALKVSAGLTHLIMDNVGLSHLHASYFDHYDNLVHVSLADNEFNFIPTLPSGIEFLDLSGNNLSFVSEAYLNYHALKVLRLSRMESLKSIHHYAFYNLPSLEKLIITDCPNVREFTDLAFGVAAKTQTEHPEFFSLARNGLQGLNETYKYLFRKMNHIDLRNNPWKCDCNILWLKEFEGALYKPQNVRCGTPSNLENKKIMELTENDLQQCHPHIYGKKSHRITIVFLSIFLIILIGILFFLVRYPKTWVNRNTFSVGPNSPYSPAPTENM